MLQRISGWTHLRDQTSHKDGEAKRGERPTQELPVGQGSPLPPWGSPPLARCDSLLQREARMLAQPHALLISILHWPASHLWPGAGTGVNQRTQGPRQRFRVLT